MARRILLPCAALTLFSGCVLPRADVGPTYVAPASTRHAVKGWHDFGYIATPARRDEIVNGFRKLEVGQSREEVRAAIGLPDTAYAEHSVELFPRYEGWNYAYHVKMNTLGANFRDELVQVFFNSNERLHWAIANNIPGLKDVGSCGAARIALPPVEPTTQPE